MLVTGALPFRSFCFLGIAPPSVHCYSDKKKVMQKLDKRCPRNGVCANWRRILLFLSMLIFLLMQAQGRDGHEDYSCLMSFKSLIGDAQNALMSWKAAARQMSPCNGSISSWNGIACNNNRVFALSLPNSGLDGSISPNLSKCSALSTLDLSVNHIAGEIPSTFGELPSLMSLNLSQNALIGDIPLELSNCSYLNIVDLHGNALQGSIPSEFGNLARLQAFDVSDNSLSGEIPLALAYGEDGTARFNASSYAGNRELYGFPLPNQSGHALSLVEIIGIGLASGIFSLSASCTAVCLWLKFSKHRHAVEEGKISELIAEP